MAEGPEAAQELTEHHSSPDQASIPPQTVAVESGSALIGRIIALADACSDTLGFLPHSVFEDAARNATLVAAVRGTELLGYALFALPRQHVRLVHLCVAEEYRGRGIAKLLVEDISARHHDRLGIILRCRIDYQAHYMWPSLGFRPRHEIRGRGKKATELVVWWRDHGHPDLFSLAESPAVLRVALDLNVFLDLHTQAPRSGSVDSLALDQDWLRDQLEMVVTSELYAEIGEVTDRRERVRQRGLAGRYPEIRADARQVQEVTTNLVAHVLASHQVDLTKDPNDLHDVRHVAEAAVAGVPVFTTRDDRLVKLLSGAALDVSGVRLLHPADVVVRLDELTRAQVYQPAYLLDTPFTVAAVGSGEGPQLEQVFLDRPRGERRSDFVARLRHVATPQQWERMLVRDPTGQPVALYAYGLHDGELVVPVIRMSPSKLEPTIARQLLLLLRQQCRTWGLSRLRLTDPFAAEAAATAALEDGFFKHGPDLLALVIDTCAPAAAISNQLSQVGTAVGLEVPAIPAEPDGLTAVALERSLWPAKISDAQLPTFLIPIQPIWSSQLFGVPASLLARPALLGMSREHVYYRSPVPRVEIAPARVLWYVSGKPRRGGRVGAVAACSRLEEVVVDDPKTLYARFRHLGVWEREQIQAATRRRGMALALRCFDTEVFPYPVPLRRLRQFAGHHGLKLALRSPQRLPPELFAAIYQEGQTG